MPEGDSLLSSSREFFERAVSLSSKEFIRGFVIGQIALLLVLIVLARVLFFRGTGGNGQLRFTGKVRSACRGLRVVEWAATEDAELGAGESGGQAGIGG